VSIRVSALLATCLGALGWNIAAAQDTTQVPVRLGGLLFGDLYYVPTHHTEDGDGAAGAVLRRGYLTFDAGSRELWSGRLRFELNQDGEFESYDFDLDVKDLYVSRNVGGHRITAGLAPTLTYDLIESIWGARYLARTPLDLQGVASRDTGLAVSGPLTEGGALSYRAMVGTALELGSDANDAWKWMGALTWRPAPAWYVDAYADYEDVRGPDDRVTLQAFTGYRTDAWRWGLQYSHQHRQNGPTLELASAFAVRRLRENVSLIGRVDRLLEPSPKGNAIAYLPFDPSARATMLIGGLEFHVLPHLTITPNTVVTFYDRNEAELRPDTDWYLRLTFFLDLD